MLKRIMAFIIFLSVPSVVFADTIYLKNGKTIVGDIIKETSYSIRINVNGVTYNYYKEEIDHFDKVKTETPLDVIDRAVKEGAQPEATERKRELIIRLLDVNGARDAMTRIFLQIINQAPEEAQTDLKSMLKVDKVVEHIIPIYAKHYEEEELKELINFYTSPTGHKHLELTPIIMEESLAEATKYFKEMAAAVAEKKKQ